MASIVTIDSRDLVGIRDTSYSRIGNFFVSRNLMYSRVSVSTINFLATIVDRDSGIYRNLRRLLDIISRTGIIAA